ncbi:SAP domain-containing ribonucleoprotein [Anthonomus grandis grandis]|uniref:SAP domain-containing ribonucleoprotein n=1 Tax=Anthonomus grandis grandis TaxID=2921223 RepID=UPI002166A997|nr:SAP domain-containing ribonucleoprotein [Anthonomus grandis grandis]
MAEENGESGTSTLDISKLKVPDLKKELKSRGLSTTGNKNDLVERLQTALKSSDIISNDTLNEEDLLNEEDDDDVHLDEKEESIIGDLDSDLSDLPRAEKRKSQPESAKVQSESGPPKKVILKRNTQEPVAKVVSKVSEEKVNVLSDEGKPAENDDGKKVIKLSELSVKERLEMRAKKFGVSSLGDEAKKLARAERFGQTSNSSNSNSAASITLNGTSTNIDVLKQRAARFGGSVSSVISSLEVKEKLEKRKERFGGGGTINGKSSTDIEAAKAARLERFKTTVK